MNSTVILAWTRSCSLLTDNNVTLSTHLTLITSKDGYGLDACSLEPHFDCD